VQLWIYGLDGQPLGGTAVAQTTSSSTRDTWSQATRSAAVALQANTYYRVEVRFVESTGSEFFQVGYAKAGATAPTTPQAILGSTKPITTGAKTPLLLVPDFAGQAVTVTLSAGVGGLIDAGRVAAKDSSATVGSASVPNLTIQGDRTDTVTLIGSMSDIQTYLQTDGNLRYSVVNDAWLKVSLTSARLATTTDGVNFTTAAYTAESVEAVRLVASAATGTGTISVAAALNSGETATSYAPAAATGKFALNNDSNSMTGKVYRVAMAAALPVDPAFVGPMEQRAAASVSRWLSVVGGESSVGFASVVDLNLEEPQISNKTGLRLNRSVRVARGVSV
jgi:hypothetical protein